MRSAATGVGGGSTLPKLPAPTIRVAQSRVKSKEENVMNVLAIGRYASCAFDAYVPAAKQRVTELREEGFISDLFFKSDKSGPILVLNNTNRDEAQWRLATLPLVEAGYRAVEVVGDDLDHLLAAELVVDWDSVGTVLLSAAPTYDAELTAQCPVATH